MTRVHTAGVIPLSSEDREDEASPSTEALGIQSIEVGLKLLRPLLDAGKPLNLKSLAAGAGYAPPKAHRYLVSLIRMKLVAQDPVTGRYGLGSLAFELGLAALGLLDRDALGRASLREIMSETSHTACLVTWANGGATVAAVEPGVGSIFLGIRIGSILSLLRSASGQAFLAYLPREATKEILAREMREIKMSNDEVKKLIERIRQEGLTRIRDTMMVGLSAVSAPVFDHDGRLAYVITCMGPSNTFDTSADGSIVTLMRAKKPGRRQALGEQIYEIAQTQVAEQGLPTKAIGRWFPFVATLMLFIFMVNFLGFIPLPLTGETYHGIPTWGIYAATSSISVTLALALLTFVFTHVEGIRWNGPVRYFKSWIPEAPKPLLLLIVPLEILGQFMRLISLSVRLFANMLAGHILILTFIGLIFILQSWVLAIVVVPVGILFYLFEVLIVIGIQAFIFAALSAIYIGSAIEPEH